tara:strand:- start:249 stop:1124 length:876 start_codon:yes stop_codon:yes gene_type:complete
MKLYTILLPVYNDWKNLARLLSKINYIAKKNNFKFYILVVNDDSKFKNKIKLKKNKNIIKFNILNLSQNMGSQRAIALAINHIKKNNDYKNKDIIIMDADGQDDPNIITDLIKANQMKSSDAIVVERTNRSEPFWFKFLYLFHKSILFLFTGNKIKFGNFSLLKFKKIKKLIDKSDIWAAYPAAIVNNLNRVSRIKGERKKRYSGKSKVNLYKLFNHSSRVFSVFKYKILIISLIYFLISYFLFKNNYLIVNFLFYSLLFANIYIFYISFETTRDFKKKFNFLKSEIRKIF